MKTIKQKREVYKQIIKGGQGRSADELKDAAISTAVVLAVGCVLMTGLWLFRLIK